MVRNYEGTYSTISDQIRWDKIVCLFTASQFFRDWIGHLSIQTFLQLSILFFISICTRLTSRGLAYFLVSTPALRALKKIQRKRGKVDNKKAWEGRYTKRKPMPSPSMIQTLLSFLLGQILLFLGSRNNKIEVSAFSGSKCSQSVMEEVGLTIQSALSYEGKRMGVLHPILHGFVRIEIQTGDKGFSMAMENVYLYIRIKSTTSNNNSASKASSMKWLFNPSPE